MFVLGTAPATTMDTVSATNTAAAEACLVVPCMRSFCRRCLSSRVTRAGLDASPGKGPRGNDLGRLRGQSLQELLLFSFFFVVSATVATIAVRLAAKWWRRCGSSVPTPGRRTEGAMRTDNATRVD